MKSRKTINVTDVIDILQMQLWICDRDERARICGIIERILYDTGNYRGFQFANQNGTQMSYDDVQSVDSYHENYYLRKY